MPFFHATFARFTTRYPALFYGLFLTFTLLFAFKTFFVLFPLALLFVFASLKQKCLLMLLFFGSFFVVNLFYLFPHTSSEGEALFSIRSVKEGKRGYFVYSGNLKKFTSKDGVIAENIPCYLVSKVKEEGSSTYLLNCTLEKGRGEVCFIKSKEPWIKQEKQFNLVDLRFEAKQKVKSYLEKVISRPKGRALLTALATGESTDSTLTKAFEKAGLLHLLAISGFHFAILASSIHFFFRSFLPPKVHALLILSLLSLYFLFIGNAASVERAWIAIFVYLLGHVIEKQSSPLNSLGVALLGSLIFNPLICCQVGFQLSFLATFAILLLYPPCDRFFKTFFPLNAPMTFLRKILAIDVAVHIALLPLCLLHFHKFPLHGIIYNLFYPTLITGALILLMVALVLHALIPPLGLALHSLNSFYTEGIFHLLRKPIFPRYTFYVEDVSAPLVTVYLTLLFLFAFAYSFIEEKRRLEKAY